MTRQEKGELYLASPCEAWCTALVILLDRTQSCGKTAADILAVQEVSQVMLGNRTAGRNDVLRAAVRPTAPVNPSVKIAVKLSAYQFMSTFLGILPVCIFSLSLMPWAHVALGGASAHF